MPITVLWRSDSSGDTYAFTRLPVGRLAAVRRARSAARPRSASRSASAPRVTPAWPAPPAGTNGAIAYIAVSYLIANRLPAVGIKNAAGRYVVPNLSAIEAAAAAVHSVPGNQVTIVNPPRSAKSAYPISTFTYAIVPTTRSTRRPAESFISYALGAGPALRARRSTSRRCRKDRC